MKKLFLIIIILFSISCEKPKDSRCYVCESEVINIYYKTNVTMAFKTQTDTLCNETTDQINQIEKLYYLQDDRDSVIHIVTTKCHLK